MKNLKMRLILVTVLFSAIAAGAEPIGTAFSYQVRLLDNGTAADCKSDFQFALYDADSLGTQVGNNVDKEDVQVADGYFTVEIDFGSSVFTDQARWLQIAVRPWDSSDDHIILAPRQKITPTPYAISTAGLESDNTIVRGHLEGTCVPPLPYPQPDDPLPMHPFEIDISELGDMLPSDVKVVVTGFKFTLPNPDTFVSEGPLVISWEVTDNPYDLTLKLKVYDENGNPYDTSDTTNWRDKKLSIDYIAAPSGNSATSIFSGTNITGYRLYGTPPAEYPFEFDISELGDIPSSDVMIVAYGSKLLSTGDPETPLMFKWEITDSPLTVAFRVWDSDGEQYSPASGAWLGKLIDFSFAAFIPDGGTTSSSSNQAIVSGKFEYTVNDYPTMPFEIPIDGFEGVDVGLINVVAAGIRNEAGGDATPLAVKSAVVDSSGLKLNLWVWDIYGNEPDDNNPEWDGKTLEVSYIVSASSGGGTVATGDKVVVDLNLGEDGNIVTGDIPQEDYYGRVTRVYLRDLPNLKARLGGSGVTLAEVNDSVKKLLLSAETYVDATQDSFEGFRWARETYGYAHEESGEIFWGIEIYEDQHTATEDTDATYKLIRVEAHLK